MLMNVLEMNIRGRAYVVLRPFSLKPNWIKTGKRKGMLDSSQGQDSSLSTQLSPGDK